MNKKKTLGWIKSWEVETHYNSACPKETPIKEIKQNSLRKTEITQHMMRIVTKTVIEKYTPRSDIPEIVRPAQRKTLLKK